MTFPAKTPAEVEKAVCDDVRNGLAIPLAAKKHHVSIATVYRILKRQGQQAGPGDSGSVGTKSLAESRLATRAEVSKSVVGLSPLIQKAMKKALTAATAGDLQALTAGAKAADQLGRALRATEQTSQSASSEPKVAKPSTTVQIAVLPGWCKAGDGAGMATVQQPVIDVKATVEPIAPQDAATAKLKALYASGALDSEPKPAVVEPTLSPLLKSMLAKHDAKP